MSKSLYLSLVISLLFSVALYIGTNSIIYSLILFVLSFLYLTFIVGKRLNIFNQKTKRFHECYFFINNFIVAISIKGSISQSLESFAGGMSEEFNEEVLIMQDMNDGEKLVYLRKFFPFHIYQLFLDVFDLWLEQGGDIIGMTSHLTNQLRESEELITFSESNNRLYLIEFSILWLFSISIIIALRFSLSIFFETLANQLFYQLGLFAIFIFILVSIEMMTRKMTSLEIQGAENENQ